MTTRLSEQIQEEIARQEEANVASKMPQDYARIAAMYEDLLKKGFIRKKEPQLRSASDPLIMPEESPFFTQPR